MARDKLGVNGQLAIRNTKGLPRVVMIHASKGGTGKTVIGVNIAVVLAQMGFRVLFVDADPQSTATVLWGLGVLPDETPTLASLLTLRAHNTPPRPVAEVAQPIYQNAVVDVVPSTLMLQRLDMQVFAENRKADLFRDWLDNEHAALSENYDVIVVDTNPAHSALNHAIMRGSDIILAPLQADLLSIAATKLLLLELKDAKGPKKDGIDPIAFTCFNAYVDMYAHTADSVRQFDKIASATGLERLVTTIPRSVELSRQIEPKGAPRLLLETHPTIAAASAVVRLTNELLVRGFTRT